MRRPLMIAAVTLSLIGATASVTAEARPGGGYGGGYRGYGGYHGGYGYRGGGYGYRGYGYRGGYGYGGLGLGLLAGAALGAAVASPYGYGYGNPYEYRYPAYGYAPGTVVYAAPTYGYYGY